MKKGKQLSCSLLLAGSMLAVSSPGFSAEAKETVEMRISRLEQELAELKALVREKPAAAPVVAPVPVTAAAPAAGTEPRSPLTVSLGSGVRAQLYGFARFDAVYDSGQMYPGNIALYAQPQGMGRNDSEWNLTAGATRLGFNLSGPDTEKIRLSGNIEIDFTGGGTENNQNPRMRHAYLKAYWPASDFSIIAGQTWDVVASQIPFTDDPAIMWDAGNIGGRHPQLRLTKGFSTGEKSRIEIAVAASRTIGEKNTLNANTPDPGRDAAMPAVQGRIALSGPVLVDNQPATIGVSGHYGQEQWDINAYGSHRTLDTWSCNLDLSLPISQQLLFAGEFFNGFNLDDYYGGIGQGVNTVRLKAIRSTGGWAAFRYALNPATSFSLGAGIDNPDDGGIETNARSLNRTVFANVINRITPNCIVGLQVGQWRTCYKNAPESNVLRAQSSMTYRF